MNALENIVLYYNQSAKKDIFHETARNMLEHLQELEGMTIYDMAEICMVSTTTISRFVKQLGYKNYLDFTLHLNDLLQNYNYHNQLLPVTRSAQENTPQYYLTSMMEQLHAMQLELPQLNLGDFTRMLHESRRVFFFCYAIVGQEFFLQIDLLVSGIMSRIVNQPVAQLQLAEQLSPEDTIVVILPDLRESTTLREIIYTAHTREAGIILITTSDSAPINQYADLCYAFNGTTTMSDLYRINFFISLLQLEYRHEYLLN